MNFNVKQPFPCPRTLCITLWLCWHIKVWQFRTYIAAVKHDNIASRGTDLPHTPRLRQMLQGVHRMQGSLRKSQPRTRLPILLRSAEGGVVGTLRRLQEVCQVGSNYPLLFFFSFFQSGEITIPQRLVFDSAIHLAWEDVAVDSLVVLTCVRVHLKRSKCDQFGKGVDVISSTQAQAHHT